MAYVAGYKGNTKRIRQIRINKNLKKNVYLVIFTYS